MNKAHSSQSTRIWFGLALISLLGGLVFIDVQQRSNFGGFADSAAP